MYLLSRLILIVAFGVYMADLILVAQLIHPMAWCVVVVGALLAYRARRKIVTLVSHGSARWMQWVEAKIAQMLTGKGMPLGRLITTDGKPGFMAALSGLFSMKLSAKEACLQFFAALRRKQEAPLVRLPPTTVHTSIFAPSGAGKSTGLIIPGMLEITDGSIVCIDLSGELMLAVAEAKYRQGYEVHILDPYGVVTK